MNEKNLTNLTSLKLKAAVLKTLRMKRPKKNKNTHKKPLGKNTCKHIPDKGCVSRTEELSKFNKKPTFKIGEKIQTILITDKN